MNAGSYSMAYIMDSKISDLPKNIAVTVDDVSFNVVAMSDTTTVKREKGWFLPLVLVTVWNSKNNCTQGKSMIEEDIPSFFKGSLRQEISRSGDFKVDTLNISDYSVELSIDELKTEGPYVSSGFFYFALYAYGYSYSDRAGPAHSTLKVSYKLKKGDQLIHSNTFTSEKITEQINRKYTSINMLQQDYAISMVEATSYNFKNTIQQIVNDLNTFFAGS
ncbi:hypothetical protein [Mangrovibacterium sp.]|uniref:hypothetical protein n=1 Tax=Mangrovibacterium sp. TaxID=1961364 RepID=UPI0035669847